MPITDNQSDLFRKPHLEEDTPDSKQTHGRLYTATGKVTNAADDLSGSTFKLAELPADCILDDRTAFDVENWGFADVRIGTKDDVDALVSATTISATTQSPIAFGDANHGKELWEVLGLAANPGGNIAIYAHAIANATGAGEILFRVSFLYH